MSIAKHLPDPEQLLALEPEELAGLLLQYLNALPPGEKNALNRYNFSLRHTVQDYPAEYQDRISRALMEAWVWLEREGFLAPKPGSQGEWVFNTLGCHKRCGRRAFQPASGALADPAKPAAEQEALAHLFAGAIGSYKNPHSHRTVTISATEAVEMVVLASHLLGIVDRP
jgi:hypothetical protein